MRQTYKKEVKIIIKLAMPVIIAQLAQTGITFVDTIMAGHYSSAAQAGVAIGVAIWLPTILFGQGLLSVLTPIISHLNGAAKRENIADHTRQGLVIASILSIIMMLGLYHSDKLILLRNSAENPLDPEMFYVAVNFLRSIMWGVPGFLFYLVYRFQCEGLSNTKPAMFIMFIALFMNIPTNYVLIYGKLGFPEFGGIGCGITAAIIFWMMFVLIKCFTLFSSAQKDIIKIPFTQLFDKKILKRITILGLPLALAYFFEISLFTIIALMIAPLGKESVSAHQITFAISSLAFAIPLSLGVATSIRVGYLLGKKKPSYAKRTAYISLSIAFISALIAALMLIVFRTFIISWFTNDAAIISICMQLIILLALYLLSDYLQATASNVLRGYKDTKSILYITLFSYWVIGLPLGYILGLTHLIIEPMGVAGFWVGIIAGLSFSAILLISRMVYIQKQPVENILRRSVR